jgi:hypothetical protein
LSYRCLHPTVFELALQGQAVHSKPAQRLCWLTQWD